MRRLAWGYSIALIPDTVRSPAIDSAMPLGAHQRPLRRDAELNRRKLIASAHEVFRERGLSATLDDVAQHAGVGVGTAYRRFANKDELLDALFEDMADAVERIATEAAADPDAWHGLRTSLEKLLSPTGPARSICGAVICTCSWTACVPSPAPRAHFRSLNWASSS
ncbi:MAG TPA: helix-turn-helix domain-containing protein [Pseudonocardiaceae bacterium]|jgi:AcrR family transcriptional regulator|nr:helix-turn-helix domain-containing protein [Pseudonocardiaceae bacterium]